jgi:hypothetical protein
LIALDAAGSLGILERLYSTIAVPDAVVQECAGTLPAWVQIHSGHMIYEVDHALGQERWHLSILFRYHQDEVHLIVTGIGKS